MRTLRALARPSIAFLLFTCVAHPLRAQQTPRMPADTVDPAAAAADAQMSGMPGMGHDDHTGMAADVHMQMTALRPPSPRDSARAAALAREIRTDLAKYRDVRVAEADGFKPFLPNVPQQVYHFTNRTWAFEEAFRFDPAKPTSLLYRHDADGSYTLVGAMYTAPRSASESTLDARIPLSVARWHQHVNWCLPPRGGLARWNEQRDGTPVFGPRSPIATEAACSAVGGRFVPHLFGWMVHANVFASDDPKIVWGHVD